ncbi:hypothetical protein VEE68_35940 [Escherichia coli]|nr:hypothetical protein VEE68_35940 [Escherichia coli]
MGQVLPLVTRQGDRIAIVSGLRTPFARQATAFHGIPAVDLGKMVVGELLARSEIPAEVIEQLVFGQVVQMPEAPNIAREIVLGTGMNVHTDAYSVSRACATSFQAVANVAESLMAGTIRAGIAGGADSSSVLPIGVSKKLARVLVDVNKARTMSQRLKLFSRLRLRDLMPVPPAVAEYSTGLRMGGHRRTNGENLRHHPRTARCISAPFASACRSGMVRRKTQRRGDDCLYPSL